jgi:hypothetical protein
MISIVLLIDQATLLVARLTDLVAALEKLLEAPR